MKSYSILSYISNFMIHFSDFSHLESENIFILALSSKEREKSSSFNFSLLGRKVEGQWTLISHIFLRMGPKWKYLPRTFTKKYDFRIGLTPFFIFFFKTYHTGRRWKFQDTNCWAQLIHTGRYHISIAHRFNWYFDLSFRSVIVYKKIKNLQ